MKWQRQAFLRWMEEEEFDGNPPRLDEKLTEARQGPFHPFDPQRYDALFYEVRPDRLRLLRVLHGYRDLQAELGK